MSNVVYPTLPGLAYSVIKTPNWKTGIQRSVSGRTLRSGYYVNPIWNFTLTYDLLDDGSIWGAGPTTTATTYDITLPSGQQSLGYYLTASDIAALQAQGATVVPGSTVPAAGLGTALVIVAQPSGAAFITGLTPSGIAAATASGATVTGYAGTPPPAPPPTTDLRTLMNFFNSRMGSFDDFLFQDPTDHDVTGSTLIRNPADPSGTQFQLIRQLSPGGVNEWITAPGAVRAVYVDGVATTGYTVDANTGIVTFGSAIGPQVITADFSYLFRVYFPDSLDFENFSYRLWELKQVKLTSVVLSTAPALCLIPSSGP